MPPRAALQCRFCDATFARQEHLTRHLRTHTREKPYPCTQCSKSFSRQDVLSRHLIAHRHDARSSATASARACLECASNRVRCSKEEPCQRCQDRQLSCIYPSTQTSEPPAAHQQTLSDTSLSTNAIHVGTTISDVPALPTRESTFTYLGAGSNVDGGPLWARNAGVAVPHLTEPGTPFDANGFTVTGLSAINWLSPDFQIWEDFAMPYQDGQLSYNTSIWNAVPETVPSSQQFLWPPPTPIGPSCGSQKTYTAVTQAQSTGTDHARTVSPGQTSSRTSKATSGVLYVDGSAGRAPFGGRLLHKQTCENTSPEGRTGTDSPASLLSDASHDHMRQSVAQYSPEWFSNSQHSSVLELRSVQNYVQSYFVHFHHAFPFIRRNFSSFEEENGWILLVAVATIGAGYMDHAAHESLSQLLSNLLDAAPLSNSLDNRMSQHRAGDNVGSAASRASQLKVLQAGVLNMILLLHSGNQQNLQRGLLQRYRLSELCHSLGLLSRRQGTGKSQTIDSDDTIANWLASQTEVRTGMALWFLDSLLSTEFACAPLFHLYDAACSLPSAEDVWARPTPERITSLTNGATVPNATSNTQSQLQTVTISEALELLYMEKRLPPTLGEFSKTLLIHAVCRRMNEAAYQHQQSLPNWTPEARPQTRSQSTLNISSWPPSDPVLVRWRNSSCDCLDVLHWNANMISAGAGGWEHPTILHLHISRLLILTPVSDIQYVAQACPSAVDGACRDPRFEEAYTNIRKWALADQFKARLAIIHAGALLWHVRRYSINSFVEPFAVYLAILVIWSYSTSALAYQRHANGTNQSRPASGDDDNDDNDDDNVGSPSSTSSDDEDPDPTFIHLDRPCDDEIVQAYVRKGQKMEANMVRVGNICGLGAPQKVLREGLRLLSGDKTWTTREVSTFGEPVGLGFSGLWGIRWTYVRQLANLAQVTESW